MKKIVWDRGLYEENSIDIRWMEKTGYIFLG